MAKQKHTPPHFLQKKLSDSTFKLVKRHTAAFLAKAKADHRGTYPATMTLLYAFVSFLGKKDAKFKGIKRDTLTSTYEGVYQVYNHTRKIVEKVDEKPQ